MMYLLIIGADSREAYLRGRSDAIRVVRIDFLTPSVQVLAFPRDMWVPIPRLSERNISEGKLNSAYSWGNVFLAPGMGPSLLAETLSLNFGMPTDHYLAINFQVFVDAVDLIGGLDVEVPEWEWRWPPGMVHMDGERALWYARYRGGSDFQRMERQNLLIQALRAKMLESITRLPSLIQHFRDNVLTDLSPRDIASLVCLARKVDSGHIGMLTIPFELIQFATSPDGKDILLYDEAGVREYVQQFINGTATPADPVRWTP
jgi:LCP family protein required for cell wall assembly